MAPKTLHPLHLIVAALSLSPLYFQHLTVEATDFDFFILSLHWPGSLCPLTTDPCCVQNACCRYASLPDFTIHGFWLDNENGSGLLCCNSSSFDGNQLSNLFPELEKYWPSLYCSPNSLCNGRNGTIWEYEWETHGSCASSVLGGSEPQYNYFSKALDVYSLYNISRVLGDAGYWPSDAILYPLEGITAAIEKATHASPSLMCEGFYLYQIRLCFNKDFTPRNCSSSSSRKCQDLIALPTLKAPSVHEDRNAPNTWLAKSKIFNALNMF